MASRTLRLALEQLADWYPRLFLDPYIVGCVAALSRYTDSPASFEVDCQGIDSRWLAGADQFTLQVSWTEASAEKAERLRATMPSREIIELAAVALAFGLARRVLGIRQLVVTARGEAADYRAPGSRRVLEMSGTEVPAEFERRHRQKIVQALRNPFRWGAYVIVCGFASGAQRIRLSAHAWEEKSHAKDES